MTTSHGEYSASGISIRFFRSKADSIEPDLLGKCRRAVGFHVDLVSERVARVEIVHVLTLERATI